MISFKSKKNRSKKNPIKKRKFKQFCKTLLVASCGFMPFKESFAQSNALLGTNAGIAAQAIDSIVAIGVNAGRFNQGSKHIFIGNNAGYNLNYQPISTLSNTNNYSGGSINIGYYAGYHTTTGDDNIFIGEKAGYRNVTGSDNVFIGNFSGVNNTGTDNTFIGFRAGLNNTTGFDNTFIGEEAGRDNTTGSNNTMVGEDAGKENTSGCENAFFGSSAGFYNTTGYQNAFFGNDSGRDNETGHHNAAFGDSTLIGGGKGNYNTGCGASAGANNEHSSYGTFIGVYAGWDNNRTNIDDGMSAYRNTYVGAFAGYTNREGTDNTGLGCLADFVFGAGAVNGLSTRISNTVFLGASSSVAADGVVVLGKSASGSGENGIAIGHQSSSTAANAIAIGYQVTAPNTNEINIGNAAHTTIGGPVNWTATSDGRFKRNVEENVVGLDFINQLRPVTYQFDTEKLMEQNTCIPEELVESLLSKNEIRYTGFIAQEVEQAAQNSNFEFSGVDKPQDENDTDYYGLRYAEFVVPLVKATQELSQKVEALEQENAQQKELLAKYEAALESALKRLENVEAASLPLSGQ